MPVKPTSTLGDTQSKVRPGGPTNTYLVTPGAHSVPIPGFSWRTEIGTLIWGGNYFKFRRQLSRPAARSTVEKLTSPGGAPVSVITDSPTGTQGTGYNILYFVCDTLIVLCPVRRSVRPRPRLRSKLFRPSNRWQGSRNPSWPRPVWSVPSTRNSRRKRFRAPWSIGRAAPPVWRYSSRHLYFQRRSLSDPIVVLTFAEARRSVRLRPSPFRPSVAVTWRTGTHHR